VRHATGSPGKDLHRPFLGSCRPALPAPRFLPHMGRHGAEHPGHFEPPHARGTPQPVGEQVHGEQGVALGGASVGEEKGRADG
jgi:hypothetical protein